MRRMGDYSLMKSWLFNLHKMLFISSCWKRATMLFFMCVIIRMDKFQWQPISICHRLNPPVYVLHKVIRRKIVVMSHSAFKLLYIYFVLHNVYHLLLYLASSAQNILLHGIIWCWSSNSMGQRTAFQRFFEIFDQRNTWVLLGKTKSWRCYHL